MNGLEFVVLALSTTLVLIGIGQLKKGKKKLTPVDNFQKIVIDVNIRDFGPQKEDEK